MGTPQHDRAPSGCHLVAAGVPATLVGAASTSFRAQASPPGHRALPAGRWACDAGIGPQALPQRTLYLREAENKAETDAATAQANAAGPSPTPTGAADPRRAGSGRRTPVGTDRPPARHPRPQARRRPPLPSRTGSRSAPGRPRQAGRSRAARGHRRRPGRGRAGPADRRGREAAPHPPSPRQYARRATRSAPPSPRALPLIIRVTERASLGRDINLRAAATDRPASRDGCLRRRRARSPTRCRAA